MMGQPARVLRDQPYLAEHVASTRSNFAKGARPRGIGGLVAWAQEQWALEIPDELHDPGIWRDYGESSVGGSVIGAPRYSNEFRRYLEASDYLTDRHSNDPDDPEQVYAKPMHAALARIAGHNPNSDWWYHASFLFQVALAFFDWRAVATRALLPYPTQPIYAEWALGLWWTRYEKAPPGRMS